MNQLHDLVADTLNSSTSAYPAEIAATVAASVHSRHLRSALESALVPYVRQVIHEQRRNNPLLRAPSDAAKEEARLRSARSPKVAGIRSSWQRAMADRVYVQGKWKFLGDCTYDDLVAAAAERQLHAERNAAKAEQYQRLAGLLREHNVATVGELPESVMAGDVA